MRSAARVVRAALSPGRLEYMARLQQFFTAPNAFAFSTLGTSSKHLSDVLAQGLWGGP